MSFCTTCRRSATKYRCKKCRVAKYCSPHCAMKHECILIEGNEGRDPSCDEGKDPNTYDDLKDVSTEELITIDGKCYVLEKLYHMVWNKNPLNRTQYSQQVINYIKEEAEKRFPLRIDFRVLPNGAKHIIQTTTFIDVPHLLSLLICTAKDVPLKMLSIFEILQELINSGIHIEDYDIGFLSINADNQMSEIITPKTINTTVAIDNYGISKKIQYTRLQKIISFARARKLPVNVFVGVFDTFVKTLIENLSYYMKFGYDGPMQKVQIKDHNLLLSFWNHFDAHYHPPTNHDAFYTIYGEIYIDDDLDDGFLVMERLDQREFPFQLQSTVLLDTILEYEPTKNFIIVIDEHYYPPKILINFKFKEYSETVPINVEQMLNTFDARYKRFAFASTLSLPDFIPKEENENDYTLTFKETFSDQSIKGHINLSVRHIYTIILDVLHSLRNDFDNYTEDDNPQQAVWNINITINKK